MISNQPGWENGYANKIGLAGNAVGPQPLARARWDWSQVQRVLIVRLRHIGDTVVTTPALHALRRFLPDVRIDIVLENWVAPVLEGLTDIDRIYTVDPSSPASGQRLVQQLRAERYDVAYNLNGSAPASLLTGATEAKHRVGLASHHESRMHNHIAPPPTVLWRTPTTHAVEQILALFGYTGVPVSDRPPTRLAVTKQAADSIAQKLSTARVAESQPIALIHPAGKFDSKTWAAEKYARIVEHLHERGIQAVAVSAPNEAKVVESLAAHARVPLVSFTGITLAEVNALAARARLFVGNDSSIGHIAAAMRTPSVVIFGSSYVPHWRPWASAPAEVVREEMACNPCPGARCTEFETPQCIRRIPVERVLAAVERVLAASEQSADNVPVAALHV